MDKSNCFLIIWDPNLLLPRGRLQHNRWRQMSYRKWAGYTAECWRWGWGLGALGKQCCNAIPDKQMKSSSSFFQNFSHKTSTPSLWLRLNKTKKRPCFLGLETIYLELQLRVRAKPISHYSLLIRDPPLLSYSYELRDRTVKTSPCARPFGLLIFRESYHLK